jgi:hypothetical protein
MSRDQNGPHESGAPASRPDTDTFRPAAGDAEDAYSAETVVKAIPRELLADLAKALKAPAVPKMGDAKGSAPGAPRPPRSAAPTPKMPPAFDALGEDDATVIDHRLDRDLSELDFDSPPPSAPLLPPGAAPEPAVVREKPLPRIEETPVISIVEPAPSSRRAFDSEETPLPSGAPASRPEPAAPPEPASAPIPVPEPSAEMAPLSTDDIDENTDFRAGTRWPWITAIVMIAISFAVTLTILRNL